MKDLLEQCLEYWSAGGTLMFPMALVCFGIWGHYIRSRDRIVALLHEDAWVDGALSQSRFGSEQAARGSLQELLARVLEDVDGGTPARQAFHRRQAECMDGLRRDLMLLCALTAVAPLLGLLGTVRGMMDSFDAVSGAAGDPVVEVAGGISEALITTQVGLLIAVPGVFAISRLRRLLRDVDARLGTIRAEVLVCLPASPEREQA